MKCKRRLSENRSARGIVMVAASICRLITSFWKRFVELLYWWNA